MKVAQQDVFHADEQFLPPAALPPIAFASVLGYLGMHGQPLWIFAALAILASAPGLERVVNTPAYGRLHNRYASSRFTAWRFARRARRRQQLRRSLRPAKAAARYSWAAFIVWLAAMTLGALAGVALPAVPGMAVLCCAMTLVVLPSAWVSTVWAYYLLPHLATIWDEVAESPQRHGPVIGRAEFVKNLRSDRAVLAQTWLGYVAALFTITVAIV